MNQTPPLRLITFDLFRSFGIPKVIAMKPEEVFSRRDEIVQADWILFSPYSLVNIMAYVFQKPVFPSISTYHLGFDKVQMTRAFLARFPEHTPHTEILPATPASIASILERFSFPFIAKEIRNARGQGTFLIQDRRAWMEYASQNDMLYVQEYLPIDRDLRVIWVADRVVLAYWRIAGAGSYLTNVAAGGEIRFEDIPESALVLVEAVARSFGIDYAGFDVALVDGHPYLFEFNLFFGTQALTMRHINIGTLIYQYLQEKNRERKGPPLSAAS